MSLLLEALKKAELTKQAAKDKTAAVDPERLPFTRDRLPDINQPLEILSEDIAQAPKSAAKPSIELALEDQSADFSEPRELAPQPAARPAPATRASAAA